MKNYSTKRCRNCVIHLRGFIPQNTYNLRRQSSRKQKSKTLDIKNESGMENSQPIFLENNTKDEEIGNTNLYYTNDLFTVNDFDSFLTSFE